MQNRALLPQTGNFYKANLHTHTVLSDGHWTKEQVKAEYQKRGYSIVAYTDHRHYGWHPALADDNFLPLAAFEADLNEVFQKPGDFSRVKTYHINFYDTDPVARGGFTAIQPPQRYGDVAGLNEFISQMNEQGFLACYNHPWWSLQTHEDYRGLRGVFAMEIYNHGCELDGLYGYAPQAYDEMLRTGTHLHCVATDDNHDAYPVGDPRNDSFGGFTMIRAPALNYGAIIQALKNGDFYASTGPELYGLEIKGDALCVRCSPVEKIYAVTQGRRCYMAVAEPGHTITEACFPLRGDEGYLRMDCRDGAGNHAYSNAYFLDVL
ncbi:MAG: PHP domain-containing protein [Gemmiger sp.]|nr:PHP domain-containing protein [Gemmiger sp.]